MATSFAAYASQFLTRQQNPQSSLSTSQPLFFSFTTDDGSHAGNNVDTDFDDTDDPHLRDSVFKSHGSGQDDQDPYLRLDEEPQPGASRSAAQSVPLISSPLSSESGSPKGWLAHQTTALQALSPPSPSSSDSGPPPDIFVTPRTQSLPSRTTAPLTLTESLLPRDGHARPIDVFTLPDPRHVSRGRRKYNDSIWTAVWLTGVTTCFVSCILILFRTTKPPNPSRVTLPYTTLLHTVPLLTILTFLSALVAYVHIFLLRVFVQPVMIATSVFIPATLLLSAIWAFIGSFMWEAGQEPTWGETVGLRIFSLVPLLLALLVGRRLVNLPQDIHVTSSTLTLVTKLLITNPFLLALSPITLLITLLSSLPFLTLVFRLLLIGYFSRPDGSTLEWHVQGWANWAITATIAFWMWSWGVARGILRTTCAGVIGAWYFANPELPPPPPSSTHIIHAALTRATSPSLGTVVLSALILTAIRLLGLFTAFLRLAPLYFPLPLRPFLQPITLGMSMGVGMLDNVTTALSKYVLVYTGLTGDAFFPSARRARALTAAVESSAEGKYLRKFKKEPPLTLLTFAPLTLTFPFALTTYLFVAHTLAAPDQALGAAVLAGGVTALVGLFCVGLVKDTADTLYMCYCIDKDVGERRRPEVFEAFEYNNQPRGSGRSMHPPPQPIPQTPQTPRAEQRSQQPYVQTLRAPLRPSPTPLTPELQTPRALQAQSHSPARTQPAPRLPHQPSVPTQSKRLPTPITTTTTATTTQFSPFTASGTLQDDTDPFMREEEDPSEVHQVVKPYDLSRDSPLPDSDSDGGEPDMFPGSGLFASE